MKKIVGVVRQIRYEGAVFNGPWFIRKCSSEFDTLEKLVFQARAYPKAVLGVAHCGLVEERPASKRSSVSSNTVYEWFTEGFDTADLKEAKALPDSLA